VTDPTPVTRPGERLLDLIAVMDRLRSPGGCPWDARQTHESLVEYLIEEAYETVEAIEEQDEASLREELGDLLLQVVFHARIATEARIATDEGPAGFDIDDVADGIITKLIARHPHVFGDATADTPEQVEANWHALKAKEKGRESVTDGIPSALPSLVYSGKVLSRSAGLSDRLPALPAADIASSLGIESEVQLGDLILALVAAGRDMGFDAETAVRAAARRRVATIRDVEGVQ
jgi:XTP/dITP diphosphohydrolase